MGGLSRFFVFVFFLLFGRMLARGAREVIHTATNSKKRRYA